MSTPDGPFGSGLGPLHARVLPQREQIVVVLEGEIDLATVPLVRTAVEGCVGPLPVALDLGGVGFCGCVGLRALRRAAEVAAAEGAGLRITAVSYEVRRLFELAAAEDLLSLCEDSSQAVTKPASAAPARTVTLAKADLKRPRNGEPMPGEPTTRSAR